jgi:hypothetical protein
MKLKIHIKMRKIWKIFLLSFLVSCQDSIPYRSTISNNSTSDPITCPEGQELITEGEGNSATQVCKDKSLTRPDNAIFWDSDFCACKDGAAISYGTCTAFCSDKNTNGAETLYAHFSVSEDISMGGLGNVYAWCKLNLPGDTQNPECSIQAKDEEGNVTKIEINISINSNSLTANIQQKLDYDKTYILTLQESTSGSKSNSIQFIKFSPNVGTSILGPLKIAPVTQYTCLVRDFSTDDVTGDIYYESAYRLHFYFIPRLPPHPIPAGSSNLICHDIFNPLYGLVDQDLYPRMEQVPGVYSLWDTMDPRFYDNNGNGTMDANENIIQKTKSFGKIIPADTKFFQKFSWPGSPELQSNSGNTTNTTQPLGYYMAPWIDQTTFKSYCPNSSHYNSSNPLFKAMRDIIGVDMEGLYIGVKSAETVTDSSGNTTSGLSDYILIRETDLKQVWFYVKNGVRTVPTDTTVSNNAIYFYYPLNKISPFVQTSTQRLYRIRGADELNSTVSSGGVDSSGVSSSYPPHDDKIGCIPNP